MIRSGFLAIALCWAASLPVAVQAQQAPRRPLIEHSLVLAPEQADDLALTGSAYDPANRIYGASFQYSASDLPDAWISLFIYPLGRVPHAQALERGMEQHRAEMRQVVEAGRYRDLAFVEEAPFALSVDEPAKAKDSAPGGADDEDILQVVAQSAQVDGAGRRLRMRFFHDPSGRPMRSVTYLFYRHLYYTKLRISAPEPAMEERAFLEFTDGIARRLLPATQVVNIGGCSEGGEINVSSGATSGEVTRALLSHVAARAGENCRDSLTDAERAELSRGMRAVSIEYDPDDWKAE